jgi:Glycosyltransferases involved in cell wall biogenesis
MQPLISIIIPTYNRERLIIKSLNSALSQTYSNIEVIIIDDGSTDNTEQMVKDYINENNITSVRYYKFENGGVSNARNIGIRLSRGEYIAFLDSDDLWDRTKITKQVNALIKSDYEICYCGTKVIGKKIYKIPNKFKSGDILIDLLRVKVDAQTITWVISKSFLIENEILFDEKCSFAEDLEFFLKCCTLGRCCVVKEYLAFYCIQDESLSNNMLGKFQEIDMWSRYKVWLKSNKSIYKLNKVNKYIDNYRLPSNIIANIFRIINSKECGKTTILYKEYESYLKKFNPLYGRYAIRYIYYLIYIKIYLFKYK